MHRSGQLRRGFIGAFILSALVVGAELGAQPLRYSITPTAQWVNWDNALGIDDAYLWGGRAGFNFGDYIELQGYYLERSRIDTKLGTDIGLPESTESSLGIRNYGADIVVSLSPTQLKPFIRAGGSLLRFAPEDGEATRQIALRYGGGIRFGNPGQLQLQLYAEDMVFRIDRNRLLGVPIVTPDPEADKLRHNMVYGAGLTVPLGGNVSGGDQPRRGLSNLSVPMEVFGGVFNFDDKNDLDGQNVVGARAGLDFGPLVGLRGYYWRGVSDNFDKAKGVQSWGGEAQFRLNAGSGLSPYLIAGAGQLDFRSDFNPSDSAVASINPVDRTMLILGGGVALNLSERVRLNVAARNHLFNGEGNIEDASTADDLTSNWMFTAGLGFNIGGSTGARRPAPPEPVIVARVDTVVVDRETGEVVREIRGSTRPGGRVMRDTVWMGEQREVEVRRGAEGYVSGRTIQLPVPSEGELYVRYGPSRDSTVRLGVGRAGEAASATDPETRMAIRSILRDELERSGRAMDTSAASRELAERRMLDRIDSAVTARLNATRGGTQRDDAMARMSDLERRRMLADIEAIVRNQVQAAMARQPQAAPQPPYVPPAAAMRPADSTAREPHAWSPRSYSAYTGLNVNKGTQFVLGGRVDLGPISPEAPRIALVPEFAIGLGNGTTALIAANAQYRFDTIAIRGFGDIAPYGQLGLGAYVGTLDGDRQLRLMLNPAYGVEFTLDESVKNAVGTSQLFVEHQGLQFFKRNRFLVGLRWVQ